MKLMDRFFLKINFSLYNKDIFKLRFLVIRWFGIVMIFYL